MLTRVRFYFANCKQTHTHTHTQTNKHAHTHTHAYTHAKSSTPGFYRYQTTTTRDPATGYYTIVKLNFYNANGISEDHSGTDGWLDIWIVR